MNGITKGLLLAAGIAAVGAGGHFGYKYISKQNKEMNNLKTELSEEITKNEQLTKDKTSLSAELTIKMNELEQKTNEYEKLVQSSTAKDTEIEQLKAEIEQLKIEIENLKAEETPVEKEVTITFVKNSYVDYFKLYNENNEELTFDENSQLKLMSGTKLHGQAVETDGARYYVSSVTISGENCYKPIVLSESGVGLFDFEVPNVDFSISFVSSKRSNSVIKYSFVSEDYITGSFLGTNSYSSSYKYKDESYNIFDGNYLFIGQDVTMTYVPSLDSGYTFLGITQTVPTVGVKDYEYISTIKNEDGSYSFDISVTADSNLTFYAIYELNIISSPVSISYVDNNNNTETVDFSVTYSSYRVGAVYGAGVVAYIDKLEQKTGCVYLCESQDLSLDYNITFTFNSFIGIDKIYSITVCGVVISSNYIVDNGDGTYNLKFEASLLSKTEAVNNICLNYISTGTTTETDTDTSTDIPTDTSTDTNTETSTGTTTDTSTETPVDTTTDTSADNVVSG